MISEVWLGVDSLVCKIKCTVEIYYLYTVSHDIISTLCYFNKRACLQAREWMTHLSCKLFFVFLFTRYSYECYLSMTIEQ